MQKVVVFEINEISPQLVRRYVREKRSNISKLDKYIITELTDVSEDTLYPSQSWAS